MDDAISSVELVNCQRMQVQVRGTVPSVAVDKTDGFLCYLGKDGMETTFVTSKVRFFLVATISVPLFPAGRDHALFHGFQIPALSPPPPLPLSVCACFLGHYFLEGAKSNFVLWSISAVADEGIIRRGNLHLCHLSVLANLHCSHQVKGCHPVTFLADLLLSFVHFSWVVIPVSLRR